MKATDQFHEERAAVLADADRSVADADHAPSTPAYRDAWMKVKKVQLRPAFDKVFAGVLKRRGVIDIDAAYEDWFASELTDMGAVTVNQLVDANFRQELKQARIDHRNQDAAQLQAQQTELNASCKSDVGNQALRVTLSAALAPFSIIGGNLSGAPREPGVIAQTVKATTGISIKDIGERGILGGDHSVARDLFGHW